MHYETGSGTVVLVGADLAEVQELARTGHRRAEALARFGRLELDRVTGPGWTDEAGAGALLKLARALSDPVLASLADRSRIIGALERGGHAAAVVRADAAISAAEAASLPALGVLPRLMTIHAKLMAGAWETASAETDSALALAHRVGMKRGIAVALATKALIATLRGDLTSAESWLAEAQDYFGHRDRRVSGLLDLAAAVIYLSRGEPAHGAELLDGSRSPIQPFALRLRGECLRATGNLDHALRAADLLAVAGTPYTAALAAWLRGLVTTTTDPDTAACLLNQAAEQFSALGMPYDAALARLELAELATVADPTGTAGDVRAGLVVFERLGARPAADRARAVLRRLGYRPPLPARPNGSLSGREEEGRPSGRRGTHQRGGREAAVHQSPDRHDPPGEDLPTAGYSVAC